MAKTYPEITDELRAFIEAQAIFFVATAPLAADGHVNLSPKGMTPCRVLDSRTVGYADLTGSGNETSAHLHENGRVTLMFCAFAGPPRILRLYGRGRTVLPDTDAWRALRDHFGALEPGTRQLIVVDVTRVQTSCGFSVPRYQFEEHRPTLREWTARKGPAGLEAYRREKNSESIDGLPTPLGLALDSARLPR